MEFLAQNFEIAAFVVAVIGGILTFLILRVFNIKKGEVEVQAVYSLIAGLILMFAFVFVLSLFTELPIT